MKRKKLVALSGSMILVLVLVVSLIAGCTGEGEGEQPRPEIILGAPLPLLYNDGISAYDNLKLAVDEINAGAGVNVGGTAYNFKLVQQDTNDLNPTVDCGSVLNVVENLITAQDADFIVGGPLRSECALATMDLVDDYETVALWSAGFLSPGMDSKVAGDYATYKYCWRLQGNVVPLIGEAVSILQSINATHGPGMDKVFIVVQNVAHAVGAGNAINASLTAAGFDVVDYQLVTTGTTDFSGVLDDVESSGATILFPWFDMPESVQLIKEWYDRQICVLPVGFVVPAHDSKAWEVFSGKCEYLVNCFPRAGVASSPALPAVADYITLHTAEVGYPPGLTWVAPVSYQAIYVLKDAIERAGTYTNADAVIAALQATNITKTGSVFGRITFDANNQCVYAGDQDPDTGAVTTWTQWIDGSQVAVYPSAVATDTVALPDWCP